MQWVFFILVWLFFFSHPTTLSTRQTGTAAPIFNFTLIVLASSSEEKKNVETRVWQATVMWVENKIQMRLHVLPRTCITMWQFNLYILSQNNGNGNVTHCDRNPQRYDTYRFYNLQFAICNLWSLQCIGNLN